MTSSPVPYRSLILGGVKSGKSGHAEWLADTYALDNCATVTLIATATAGDEAMHRRIERHKAERNKSWRVIEEPLALASTLRHIDTLTPDSGVRPCIVIDCLTLWITNLLMQSDTERLRAETESFKHAVQNCQSRLIIVSNETNMGVTPMDALSRQFCDETGLLHQALGHQCEHVALMVAGIATSIKKVTL